MNFHKLLLLGVLALATACGNDEPKAAEIDIKIAPDGLEFTYEKGEVTLTVACEREWTAYSNDSWITVEKQRDNRTVRVAVGPNDDTATLVGKVTVKAGTTTKSITVTQEGRPEEADPSIPTPEGYKLVWRDEFDSGSTPSDQWWYETGAGGWGNHEIQNYVAGKTPTGVQLATVKDGILTITCDKINGTVYSIRMNTGKSWTYGYFEARLKLPKGKGTWPAFWMMPKNFTAWPDDGEIDIMEEVGYHPNYVSSSIHCRSYYHSIGTQKTREIFLAGAQDDFHVYALEWTKDAIRTYVDGKLLFEFLNDGAGNKSTWPFYTPFYLKLNLAWGGDWGGAQGVDESALPAKYEIDYVRVFQKK